MIDAQQMEHRGVKVSNMHNIFHGVVSKRIGLTMTHPSLNAATAQPHAESFDVVVPTRLFPFALEHGSASKLTSPDDQRILQKAPLFEVGQQRPGGFVGEPAAGLHV